MNLMSYPDSSRIIGGVRTIYIRFLDLNEMDLIHSKFYKNNIGRNVLAPDGPYISKGHISSDSLSGHVTLFHFWATTCSPCVRGLKNFDHSLKEFLDSGNLKIYHFSEEPDQVVQPFLNRMKKAAFPGTFINGCDELFKELGISGMPAYFVISKEGKIEDIIVGESDDPVDLKKAIRKCL
jgi:thiol-disulfide isomerase/thioredoxin